jgi:hypothetical protein
MLRNMNEVPAKETVQGSGLDKSRRGLMLTGDKDGRVQEALEARAKQFRKH